jgi:SAM-dependent methyltransferase
VKLRLSARLSWHARGEAAYSWHRATGDVCEMSRDVVALALAFDRGAELDAVCAAPPAGLDGETARRFALTLRGRDVLLGEGDEDPPQLAARRPYVPARALWERAGDGARIWGRGGARFLDGGAALLARCDGGTALGALCDRARWPELLRLCEADLAALKLLPAGAGVPPWAESTMPWPALDPQAIVAGEALSLPHDLAAYHARIGDAGAQFDEIETTLSHLFRAPHRALGGATFGARLARGLGERGAKPSGARVLEVGGGLGFVGRALSEALGPASYLVVDRSPALARAQRDRGLRSVVGDARSLPIADRSIDLVIANEMAGDLPTEAGENRGALALVDECARVLAPGGLAYVSEFGHPSEPPRRSDHLDHDEHSLRFDDLAERARARGLAAELAQVPALIGLDGRARALTTTRASFAALKALFASHSAPLEKRAWLEDELAEHARAHGIDLAALHGLTFAPISERTMGLHPGEFWALLARKPSA